MSPVTAPSSSVGTSSSNSVTKQRSQSSPAPSPPLVDLSHAIRSAPGTPTWEMARFYPAQGDWTEEEYLALGTNHLIEFDNGVLEFLPMPVIAHQLLVQYLYDALKAYVVARQLGTVVFAPYAVRVADNTHREPNVLFVPKSGKLHRSFTEDAALVAEIVSEGAENRQRDLVAKRADYVAAGIPEYWIVDRETQTVAVLTLPDGGAEYAIHGEFKPGETATSVLLDGFTLDVTACFAAAKPAK